MENGVSSQVIIKGLRRASSMAVNKIHEIAVNTNEGNKRETLKRLAATAMTSKLIHRNSDFFTKSKHDSKPHTYDSGNTLQWSSTPFSH